MNDPMETLRADYATVYKCLERERAMRNRVFGGKPGELRAKLAEIDVALDALARIKDVAKITLLEQSSLFTEQA